MIIRLIVRSVLWHGMSYFQKHILIVKTTKVELDLSVYATKSDTPKPQNLLKRPV